LHKLQLKKYKNKKTSFNLLFAVRYPESSSAIHRSSLLVANSACIKAIPGIAINDNKTLSTVVFHRDNHRGSI
jgi:hypothetical protein